jgi:Ca2+-binding RTX toxin-like protein
MPIRLTVLALAMMTLVATMRGSVFTAAGQVPNTNVAVLTQPITPNTLKPAQCAALNLTTLLTGNGNITGTSAPELILGGPAAQTLKGSGGGDCLIGGGGVDHLQGAGGFDVCIGNATTIFNNCNQTYVQ